MQFTVQLTAVLGNSPEREADWVTSVLGLCRHFSRQYYTQFEKGNTPASLTASIAASPHEYAYTNATYTNATYTNATYTNATYQCLVYL